MNFGLTPEQLGEIKKNLCEPLLSHGASLWFFGSRARGDHKEFSDLDIMVDSPDDLSAIIGQIKEYFEKSNFPFKIDLVEKKNFAKAYLPNFEKEKKKI